MEIAEVIPLLERLGFERARAAVLAGRGRGMAGGSERDAGAEQGDEGRSHDVVSWWLGVWLRRQGRRARRAPTPYASTKRDRRARRGIAIRAQSDLDRDRWPTTRGWLPSPACEGPG